VIKKIISALIVGTMLFGALSLRAATVMVFAAASLTESLQEIAAAYEKQSATRLFSTSPRPARSRGRLRKARPPTSFFPPTRPRPMRWKRRDCS